MSFNDNLFCALNHLYNEQSIKEIEIMYIFIIIHDIITVSHNKV